MKLTEKQKLFCNEYLVDFNATRAYSAVYDTTNLACRVEGSKNLSKPNIQAYLNEKRDKLLNKLEITQEKTLKEIANLAFSNLKDAFDEKGNLLDPKDWPDSITACISSIEVVEEFEGKGADRERIGWTKKVRLWNKTEALKMLGQYFAMFTDKKDLTIKGELSMKTNISKSHIDKELDELDEKIKPNKRTPKKRRNST